MFDLPNSQVVYKEWTGDLIMCPSQIYKTFNDKYQFYLRWRWDDPWTVQCNDVFLNEEFSLYYSHDNYLKLLDWIENNLEKIFKYVDENPIAEDTE